MRNIYESAEDVDSMIERAHALRTIAREARKHGMCARVVGISQGRSMVPDHVLVTSPEGSVLVTRSATKLAQWLGY
jgi:hypothetical protein